MKGKKFAIALIALMAITSGMVGMAAADTNVDPNNVDTANGTYETIQEGVDNAGENETVYIAPGEYEENVTVETENVTLASSTEGESVTVNGTLNVSNVSEYTVTDDVEFTNIEGDSGSGAVSIPGSDAILGFLEGSFMGVPVILWGILAIAIAAIVYSETRNE